MKITVKGHTRKDGTKVKGYTYTRGTTKRKPVRRRRSRHASAAEAERAEMGRIFNSKTRKRRASSPRVKKTAEVFHGLLKQAVKRIRTRRR